MTSRERWTIYPLLVLALGASLKDKIIRPATFEAGEIKCNEIQVGEIKCSQVQVDSELVAAKGTIGVVQGVLVACQEFRVVDKQGKRRVAAGSVKAGSGGAIDVYGQSQDHAVVTLAADQDGDAGIVRTATSDGVNQVVLLSTPESGALATFSRDHRELIRLTDINGQGAILTYDEEGNRYMLLRASIPAPRSDDEAQEPPSEGEQEPAAEPQEEPETSDGPNADAESTEEPAAEPEQDETPEG